jgi:hypothetical protein
LESYVQQVIDDSLDLKKHHVYVKLNGFCLTFWSPFVQVCSSRVVARKEGAVTFCMSSVILEMLLRMLIMVVGIYGDIDNAALGHDQDLGPGLTHAVLAGGHIG